MWIFNCFSKHNSNALRLQITPDHTQIAAEVRWKLAEFACLLFLYVLMELCSSRTLNGMKSICTSVICYTCYYLWLAHNSCWRHRIHSYSWPFLVAGVFVLCFTCMHYFPSTSKMLLTRCKILEYHCSWKASHPPVRNLCQEIIPSFLCLERDFTL